MKSILPIDVFFETLNRTNSQEEAFKALKTCFVKRKLELGLIENGEEEFEEIYKLLERDRCLSEILK
jgi:hypothetical protein